MVNSVAFRGSRSTVRGVVEGIIGCRAASEPRLVAMGHGETMEILDQQSWKAITKGRI
jgi:hypothetical protein